MGKIGDFLTGIQVLEEVDSPVNGKIKVVKGIAFGTYIQVEGLTQSGGILKSVWRKPLKKISNSHFPISNVLILGLGGGTVAGLARQYWPDPKIEITGVDLDPIMIDLGRKYLGLDEYNVKVIIDDADEYIRNKGHRKGKKKIKADNEYGLILIDLYIGREYPKKFGDDKFVRAVKDKLSKGGIAIFNRLYFDEKRAQAVKFGNKLENIFKNVDVVYPEANIMYLCS